MADSTSSGTAGNDSAASEPAVTRWTDGKSAAGIAWVERGGRFVQIETGGASYSLEELDSEQLSPKVPVEPCGNAACPQRFPSLFSHCPDCGKALAPAFASAGGLWSFPGADGDGLLNTERVDIEKVSAPSSEAYQPPEAPNLTLAVAGTPRRLVAIDREHSRIFAFNRESKSWHKFISEVHFDFELPKWSWAVPAFDSGIALATESGPAVIGLDAVGAALRVTQPDSGTGRCLAGPGVFEGRLLFLCVAEGKLTIAVFDPRAESWQAPTPLACFHAMAEDDVFAAPVSDKTGTLFWAGARGYVSVRAVPGRFEASWRDWPVGFLPELRLRPIWTAMSLWQFGVNAGQLQFVKIALRGEQIAHDVETTHLTAGECSYTSGMRVYSTPWDEEQSQEIGNGDSFYMPVCGLIGVSAVVADCGFDITNRRVNPDSLLQDQGQRRPAKLKIHRRGSAPVELGRSPAIASLQQLQAVVFDGNLLIYDSASNTINSWEILAGKNGRD